MVYVGIDIAKDKHDCCAIDSDGVVLCNNHSFPNSASGFLEFLKLTREWSKLSGKIKVGFESTGHYSTNLLSFLKTHDFEIVEFNPLSVSRFRSAESLRRTKTDKNDARYIARLLMTDNSSPYREQSYQISVLKSITRARYRLNKEIQPLQNRFVRLLHILFPEVCNFFDRVYCKTALALFSAFPSAKDIAQCNILKLTNLLQSASKGRLKRDKAEKLKALARSSIGTYNKGDAFELRLYAARIEFLLTQRKELEKEIDSIMDEFRSPIVSIPGISNLTGAIILAEIGDIRNFANPAKLLAFAGCEPSTYQSGNYTANKAKMVKHGSKYLRKALYTAANDTFLHCSYFRNYINKKVAEGKHRFVAYSHAMKKLVRVIFAMLTNNKPFTEPV